MEPSAIGPYLLLGLGSVAIVAVIVGHFRELPAKSSILMWVFGIALLGIGSYGPAFLADYVGFVKALNQFAEAPGASEVAEFLDRADRAGVSSDARVAVVVDVLGRKASVDEGNAVEAKAAVDEALEKLPQESENRAVLNDAKARMEAEFAVRDLAKRQIDAASSGRVAAPTIEARELEPLLRLNDVQLRELHTDRETVTRAQTRAQEDG